MKKLTAFLLLIVLSGNVIYSQPQKLGNETDDQKAGRMAWWTHDRFGMFIHWGIYSLAARHEKVKNHEKMTDEKYQIYFDLFDPDLYNPQEWAEKAKEAGMKYAVMTAKHHDGFCLFDSKYTDYKATNTPAGRDLIKEYVDAFRAEGLKVGLYYSLIDWHHPGFTVDITYPGHPDTKEEYDRLNKGRDMEAYRLYMKNQVRELLTNYGKIDILFLDYSYPREQFGKDHNDWDSKGLLALVRNLQPGIIVNDRLDLRDYEGGWDFFTPEQYVVNKCPEVNGRRIPWETCHTFSGSWGYHRDETTWKETKQLLGILIESVSKGGNMLLNVGPTGRGNFDYRVDGSLKKIGEWMKYNGKSIHGCTQAPDDFMAPENSRLTYNAETKRLYVHLFDYPVKNLKLPGYGGKIKYAQFLHDGSEIKIGKRYGYGTMEETNMNDIYLEIPVNKPNPIIPVIELVLND